jgi:hypothetical protein
VPAYGFTGIMNRRASSHQTPHPAPRAFYSPIPFCQEISKFLSLPKKPVAFAVETFQYRSKISHFRSNIMARIYNFNAGPSPMPLAVLVKAQSELLEWAGAGMSVMEMSHRSKEFQSIIDEAES